VVKQRGGRPGGPDWEDWSRRVRRELIPRLQNTRVMLNMVPENSLDADVKYAVELGLAIMLNKPIILLVQPGTRVPERLVRVADRIIEADMHDPIVRVQVADRIKAALEEIDPDG
jgi:hypothetical protein